jgi:hypothetical protein
MYWYISQEESSIHNSTCHLAFNLECHVVSAALCLQDTSFILNCAPSGVFGIQMDIYIYGYMNPECIYHVFDNLAHPQSAVRFSVNTRLTTL